MLTEVWIGRTPFMHTLKIRARSASAYYTERQDDIWEGLIGFSENGYREQQFDLAYGGI